MNIHGHKFSAKKALQQERHWEGLIREHGDKAKKHVSMWARIKRWHTGMVLELKAEKKEKGVKK